jgi:hypothetical protein
MNKRRSISRGEVMDHFLSRMPWPTPTELAPIAIYIKHKDSCPSKDRDDEAACKCEATFSAVSERMPGWRMSVVLPRFGAKGVSKMPTIEGAH